MTYEPQKTLIIIFVATAKLKGSEVQGDNDICRLVLSRATAATGA